ncbi:MAG: FAD-binding protein [Acidiferrobacterales bacterium]|nr:FAD-binding protein [Acidiferrobacterales bacterium]
MSSAVETVAELGAIQELQNLFGDRIVTSRSACREFGSDESFHGNYPPDAVFAPRSTQEVVEVVEICARHKFPVIPYGTGTSLEGHVCALHGGICLNMIEMNEVLKVNAEDLDVVVQPGVTRKQLNHELKDSGLFFPIDPGADASLGGMTATRASGTNAVRYGTMRENVLSLTVVMADGEIIKTARRSRKSAAGYDLTHLMVGSEGTLGIITEITLRVYGIPEKISSAVVAFPELRSAVDAVILTIQLGIPIARIELLDDSMMEALNRYSKMDYPEEHTLFLEFHGSENSVREQVEMVQMICEEHGGGHFNWTVHTEERNRLWQARHDAAYAAKAMRPNAQIWATDVCVPISRLAQCITETKEDIVNSGLLAPIVGHVGDGNFHLVLLVDHTNPEEEARAQALHETMVMRALEMDGTCTGEHGIGYGKLDFLVAEHGAAVSVMRTIKKSLDPDNILNPGKIVRV